MSGYSKEELIGRTHSIIKDPNTPNLFYKKMWEYLEDGKEWIGEIKNKKKNGDMYWVSIIIKPKFKDDKICGYTSINHDITDKKFIEQLSITDELTKLYNRRFFNAKIEEELNRAKRENKYLSLFILDVDYFKQYNDTYGHQMGDIVLEKVALVLKNRTNRASDFAFRLGGEEFSILSTLEKEKAIEFAQIIKDEIENLQIEHQKSLVSKYLTISIGIASTDANEIINSDMLYKEADDNLYEAKRAGRNRVFIK
jgi:diguanylate cyclase (GGDEF)-like protein